MNEYRLGFDAAVSRMLNFIDSREHSYIATGQKSKAQVINLLKRDLIELFQCDDNNYIWMWPNLKWQVLNVTYWMPLPEPPKEIIP